MNLSVAVAKNYGRFRLEAEFTTEGDRLGLFGESGSGKSTLVNLLAGTVTPDEGSIHLDGECLYSSAAGVEVPPEKRRIAVVFQHPYLFPHMNVTGNLLYGYRRCAPENRRIELGHLAGILKLEGLLERGVNNLSGGEKQRVALGRAILSNPRLLLMDEPLSALDDDLKYQIIPYLKSVSDEFQVPFLFISHSLVEMRLMVERVIVFEQGRIIARTTADQLARQRLQTSQTGYINLLKPGPPHPAGDLYAYPWGGRELLVSFRTKQAGSLLELSSKDMILFKKHPEAISARNLLECGVRSLFSSGRKIGVELDCAGNTLIAEVVQDAVNELGITPGSILYAAIKASAFRILPG